jgi:hypothetical protein
MADTELERAEKRFAQAKARLQGIRNREATKQRKMDTRRKVILGAALIDLASRDSTAAAMLDRLVRNLPREQDSKAFIGWDAPSSLPSPAPPSGEPGSDPDGTS